MKTLPILAAGALVLTLYAAAAVPADSLLIRNADVETMTDSGRLETTDVLIKEGRVSQIGKNLPADGLEVVEATGKRLTPGLFSSLSRLGVVEISGIAQTRDDSVSNKHYSASFNVIDAFNPLSTAIPENRIHGLTRVLVVPQASTSLFAGIASVVNLSGSLTGSVDKEAVAVVVNYNEYSQEQAGGSRAAALATIRNALLDAREYQQNKEKYLSGEGRELSLGFNDLEALIPVLEKQRYLIVNVDRASDILKVIELGRALDVSVILNGAQEGWMVAMQIADAQIPVILDPIFNLPTRFETIGARLENAAMLDEAGVTLLFAGMGGMQMDPHNAYLVSQSAGNSVANGLPYQSALEALFSNPSKVFGLAKSGTIEVGQSADLVLWSGDPLELLREAELVMINGEKVPMTSRATRLRDRYFSRLQEQGVGQP